MAAGVDGCRLEGWLTKKKGDYHKTKFFHYDSMRWFKLQDVNGTDHAEVALCYYKSQKDKEPRGWIFMKDVTEIFDSDTGFTLVSPARTLNIETSTPAELSTWLRALVDCCPHAVKDRVRSICISQAKPTDGSRRGDQWSKEADVDHDEYRPLDRDGLLQLNSSARTSRDNIGASGKSFDRSISLFSRNADGDKNSFYFASSGQTQALAALPAETLNRSSDEEDVETSRHRGIVGEGETLAQLGGMQRQAADRRPSGSRERDSSRGSREGDHRLGGGTRAAGGYGGGDSSTSNRLHRHIARDSPARGPSGSAAGADPTAHVRVDSTGSLRGLGDGDATEEKDGQGNGTPPPEGFAFNSTSSLQVQRGSPLRGGRATPSSPQSTRSPHGGVEVLDANEQRERVLRSKAMLRDRQRRSKARAAGSSDSGSGSDAGSGGDGNSSDSSTSERDYERGSRTATQARRRVGSRDEGEGQHSGQGTPTHRIYKGAAGSGNSGGNLRNAVPAPSGAPPRRARDALAQEAAMEGQGSGRVRESLDDVLRRRPSADSSADAKQTQPGSGRPAAGGDDSDRKGAGSDEDVEDGGFDFKAEVRRYGGGSRDGDFGSAASDAKDSGAGAASGSSGSGATGTSGTTGPSRPPRPPPPINTKGGANIYAASAAAVKAGVGSGSSNSNSTANTIRRGTSTPPRQAGDPGCKSDANFVEEDWDAEEELSHGGRPGGGKSSGAGGDGGGHGSGVRADPNWLEEDFDEI